MGEQHALDHLDLERWLALLRRRWGIIAACVVLLAGSATIFSLTRQKQYTATASLLFSQSQIGPDLLGNTNSSSNTDPATQAETNVRLVESSAVAARVASALGRGFSPLRVASSVSASQEGQSNVVAVQAQDPSPTFAARLATLYANAFIAFQTNNDRSTILRVRSTLTSQLDTMSPAEVQSPAGVSLQARIEQLNTLAAAQTGDAQLLAPAGIPTSPSYPKTSRNIVIGGSLGLLLGLGLVLLLERLYRRVRGREELSQIYGVPVLVEVPESDVLARNGQSERVTGYGHDAFDMLRARLRYYNLDGGLKSLLVTSSGPQEGKTTVAWNLACATALSSDSRVLLLDADLRRTTLARAHGLQSIPGLSDVLVGDCDYGDAIQRVEIGPVLEGSGAARDRSLDVIVAGPVPPNPAELIESKRMKQLIDELTAIYGFVIIDSGPALLVPDPLALIPQVAGVLVVSRVGSTKRDAAVQLREELLAIRAQVVGVVANGVKRSPESSYYYGQVPRRSGKAVGTAGARDYR